MKNLTVKLSLIIVLALPGSGYGQSTNWDKEHLQIYNHRYWYYRYRLINDFMVLGTNNSSAYSFDNTKNTGFCLPMEQRNQGGRNFGTTDPKIYFGDEPQELGWYMAVLATEIHNIENYATLYTATQSLKESKYELYCAMEAFTRLDQQAEYVLNRNPSYWGTGTEGTINGFLLRDDVDDNFLPTNWSALNSHKTELISGVSSSYQYTELDHTANNYQSSYQSLFGWTSNGCYTHASAGSEFMSKDHVLHLIMGLVCTIQFVNDTDTYEYTGPSDHCVIYNFKTEAKTMLTNLFNFVYDEYSMGYGDWFMHPVNNAGMYVGTDGIGSYTHFIDPSGAIMESADPYCTPNNNIHEFQVNGLTELGGANNFMPRSGLNAACFGPALTLIGHRYVNSSTYNGYTVDGDAEWVFFTGADPGTILAAGQTTNDYMFLLADALSNYTVHLPGIEMVWSKFWRNYVPKYVNMSYTPAHMLASQGAAFGYEIYYLLWEALYPNQDHNGYFINDNFFFNLMSEAPCEGPYWYGNGSNPYWDGFTTAQRFIHPPFLQNGLNNGEFNGLDYMLLYNLFIITHNGTSSVLPNDVGYVEGINGYIDGGTVPFTGLDATQYGNTTQPFAYRCFAKITDTGETVNSDADYSIQAPEIKYPRSYIGVSIAHGATYKATPAPLNNCENTAPVDGYTSPRPFFGHTNGGGITAKATDNSNPDPVLPGFSTSQSQSTNTGVSMKVYPNPSSGQFFISLNLPVNQQFIINVINSIGQVIYASGNNTSIGNGTQVTLDGSPFPNGVYNVIVSTSGNILQSRIIKQ